jgi:hypothetical protein
MTMTTTEIVANLGPLAPLAGIWEGDKGDDIAPSDDRGTENNRFRERISFEPFGPVNNHEQELFGLRYSTVAWRIGEPDPFHEETGYWLWDKKTETVMRCFIVPRGITVIAGGKVKADAKKFTLTSERGSTQFGICAGPFLESEFRTTKYLVTVIVTADGSFSYEEDTQLQIKGKTETFHHTDKNVLRRVGL